MRIVHADSSLVVVDKPAGMLSVPGRGEDRQECAALRVRAQFEDALVVHRLDMATSGLLVFARGLAMQRRLSIGFASREVRKRYLAVVHGHFSASAGQIDLPLAVDWPNRPRQKVDERHGKPSLTRYHVISKCSIRHTTRVELEPLTGRSHQLRVHLQALGHPIVGDALYGPSIEEPMRDGSTRLLLHATELCFIHPGTGRPFAVTSEAGF